MEEINFMVSNRKKRLACVRHAGWHVESLEVFQDFFPVLVNTFEVISEGSSQGWNAESARQAEGF